MGLEILIEEAFPGLNYNFATSFSMALDYISREATDLIILDINIPEGENGNMIKKFRSIQPNIKILVFTALHAELYAAHYIQAGANSFVSKLDDEGQLIMAIKNLIHKDRHLQAISLPKTYMPAPYSKLSQREQEVLHLMLQGKFTQEIASDLDLKASTISTYKSRIFEKLAVDNVVELMNKIKINGDQK